MANRKGSSSHISESRRTVDVMVAVQKEAEVCLQFV